MYQWNALLSAVVVVWG